MIVKGTASITINTKVVTIVTLESGSTLVGVVLQGHELQWVGENAHYHVETDPTSNTTLTLLETYGGATKTAFSFQIMTGYHGHNLIRVEPEMLNAFYSLQRNFERISDLFTPLENLTGDVTSVGNVTTLTNAPVIAKVLTGYTSGAGTISATDSILSAIQKLNGNNATNANLTGPITSVGNATAIASQTGTGTTFVVNTSPTIITPTIASLIGNKLYPASNSTTAIQILKADGTTAVITVDTTNSYMGIGTVEPVHKLSIKQANSGDYQLHLMQSNSNDGYLLRSDAADGGLSFSRRSGSTITETVRFTAAGNVGIGTTSPAVSGTGKLHIGADTFRLDTNRTPATSGATGNLGDICSDANYLYRASATNTWKRIAWTSF